MKRTGQIVLVLLLCVLLVGGMMWIAERMLPDADAGDHITMEGFSYAELPKFDGKTPYVVVNGNVPFFDTEGLTEKSYEYYGKLDSKGRCTAATANVGRDLMPTSERESIGAIKPSGWHTVKYEGVDGNYLYNRCHLIGFQLTGENANEKNLITGTRYLNTQGMLPFENMVADYVKETDNHVMYRVTPIFLDGELVARGVLMEGYSVEDDGEGVCFNVFCYNNQPEIEIDYATGESRYVGKTDTDTDSGKYVLNTKSMKFHHNNCSSVNDIAEKNKEVYSGSRDDLIRKGYSPCGSCKP